VYTGLLCLSFAQLYEQGKGVYDTCMQPAAAPATQHDWHAYMSINAQQLMKGILSPR